MPLRKAKVPDGFVGVDFLNRNSQGLQMIRRVEKLREEISVLDGVPRYSPDEIRILTFMAIENCHADLCEIAGVEREESD